MPIYSAPSSLNPRIDLEIALILFYSQAPRLTPFYLIEIETILQGSFNLAQNKRVSIMILAIHRVEIHLYRQC